MAVSSAPVGNALALFMEAIQALTVCGLLCATVLNYFRFRDVLYPPVIQASVWLVVVTLYVFVQDSFNPLSDDMYLVVLNGVFMFGVGGYVTTFSGTAPKSLSRPALATAETFYSRLVFWLPLFGLPLWVARAYSLGNEGPTDFLLINVRHLLLTDGLDNGYGVLQYLLPLSFLACGLQLYKSLYIRNRIKLAVSTSAALSYAVLSTGRTFMLLLIIMMAGILTITRRVSPVRSAFYFVVAAAIGFIAVGYLLQKGILAGRDLPENLKLMQGHVTAYLVGALPAFDQYLHSVHAMEYGDNTLRSILAILEKLGCDVKAPELIQEATHIPMEFNVYTVYHPYFQDFALAGVILVQLFLGAWHGYIYKKAVQEQPLYVFMYSLFLFPLAMQFFQDQYFSLLSMWIQFGALMATHVYTAQLHTEHSAACRA